jgi:O-antigen/teichoic acid export membrane protein
LPAIAIALPFQYLVDMNLYTYRSKLANRNFAIATFLYSGILIAAKYFSAVQWDLNGVISAKIIVSAIFGIVLSVVTYRKFFGESKPYLLSKIEKKAVDKYSIQYMITNGIWAIFMLNDILLLGIFGSDASVIADYKVAYFLPGNLSILSGAIGMFVAPYFVKNETDNNWVRRNYFKTLILTSIMIGGSVLILFLFSNQLIVLLFGNVYSNINNVMRLLLIASFANSGIRVTTANILASMGQIKYNMIISFSGIILQVVMNIFMIPRYGINGVAITSITVYTIMAALLLIIFVNKYKYKKQ